MLIVDNIQCSNASRQSLQDSVATEIEPDPLLDDTNLMNYSNTLLDLK